MSAWLTHLPHGANATCIAAQSEKPYLFDDQFLVLPRDWSAGHGLPSSLSLYRHIDIFISWASSVHTPHFDRVNGPIAPNGTLVSSIILLSTAHSSTSTIAPNGPGSAYNGGADDDSLLNENWEGVAVLPGDGQDAANGWHYVIALNDIDLVTEGGYMSLGSIWYRDEGGFVCNKGGIMLQIQLPKGAE